MLRSIRWRIAVPYVLLIVLAMAALAIYLSGFVRRSYLASLEDQLAGEARLVADALVPALAGDGAALDLDAQARHYADLLDARVTLIAPDGTVVGESHEDRAQMDNHLYRPEVQAALAWGQGSSIRYSSTVGYDMMYVAVPAASDGQVAGIVRVALPLDDVQASVAHLRGVVLTATLLAAMLAVLLALFVAGRTTGPLRRLTDTVEHMSAGDLSARLIPTTRDEVGTLTRAFNLMADRLQETITTLREEHSRLAGILEHMADGVLITDGEGRVRLVNPAALRLLGVGKDTALGHSFAQAARDHRLIELWRECRDQGRERVETMEMSHQGPSLQAIVTPLEEAEPGTCLLVLQDLTQVRRSETVRRDFVSNVSHELRTPLASLKALAETLRDGALDDPPAAHRFLERMETEVDALTQMVQELLELSRIESGQSPLQLKPETVADIVILPVERLRPQAERAGLTLAVELPPDLPQVQADLDRARQVVTNLVHNAIKFTPAGGSITVRAKVDKDTGRQGTEGLVPLSPCLQVLVEDTGVGISPDDLPRIFERFYKADRARSGGGTGLGLAIAKHIVQAHGGRLWAESIEGHGSTFYFTLPLA
jgi:two-component system phosphate regulon sensor histidine kinase PhoR